jgi:hypothetical protein
VFSSRETTQPLTEAEIRALVTSQRKVLRSLAKATPEQRAAIYGETMGQRITYNPDQAIDRGRGTSRVYSGVCRKGDSYHYPTAGLED